MSTIRSSAPRRGRTRRVGRPRARASAPDVRANLLASARAAFTARGFDGVSLRAVAKHARTTPAMVHYYFGDKDGLFRALLEDALGSVLARVRGGLAERSAAGAPQRPLDVFFAVAEQVLGVTPWIPQLVIREVLGEGGRFRNRFIEGYARPMSELLRSALRSEVAAGRLRADLDAELSFVSLLSLAAFPFIAQPVIERALGISYTPAFRERLAGHTRRLFLEGARA